MKKINIFLLVIVFCFFSLPHSFVNAQTSEKIWNDSTVSNVIVISWDGAQKNHVDALIKQGKLPNLSAITSDGSMTPVVIPPILKVDGDDVEFITEKGIDTSDATYWEQAVTDSGHARLLSGQWSYETGLCKSFSQVKTSKQSLKVDYYCGNNLNTAKDGVTVMEKINKYDTKGEFLIGATVGRHSDTRQVTKKHSGTSLEVKFNSWDDDKVSILIPKGQSSPLSEHGFFSTTFANAITDLDYFFDSDSTSKYTDKDSHMPVYDTSNTMVFGAELKDSVVAKQASDFITDANTKDKRFFLFVHFVEPDLFGHFYGENSEEYSKALISNDTALKTITDTLSKLSIDDDTLIMVTTDHGAKEGSSAATFLTKNNKKTTSQLGALHGQGDLDNHVVWMANNMFTPSSKILLHPHIGQISLEALGISTNAVKAPKNWERSILKGISSSTNLAKYGGYTKTNSDTKKMTSSSPLTTQVTNAVKKVVKENSYLYYGAKVIGVLLIALGIFLIVKRVRKIKNRNTILQAEEIPEEINEDPEISEEQPAQEE